MGWWQAEFTDGADPEYEDQIIPLAVELTAGAERVLEIGCGEGQVSRAIVAASGGTARVTGLDPTVAQVEEAQRRGGGPRYLRADSAGLPFAADSFDAVVVCLVLEHVDALDETLAEVARVLEPGGTFVLFLNHPLLQTPGSGWIDDQILEPPEQYWRVGPYLPESSVVEEVQKDVFIRFVHRPLGRYVNGLLAHGLALEALREPAPPPAFLALAPEYAEAATIPRLLVLVARR